MRKILHACLLKQVFDLGEDKIYTFKIFVESFRKQAEGLIARV